MTKLERPLPLPFAAGNVPRPPSVCLAEPGPCIEGGRYPVKRIVDQPLPVSVDLFKDGHDLLAGIVKWRKQGATAWANQTPLAKGENDRWSATISFPTAGMWEYTFEAWPDDFSSWKKGYHAKLLAGSDDLPLEKEEGALLIHGVSQRARAARDNGTADELLTCADTVRDLPVKLVSELLLSEELQAIIDRYPNKTLATTHSLILKVDVERERAQFSAWYEFFPRSAEGREDKHSTFRDCLGRLDDAQDMGFNVIYFPPIHPIGVTNRKGKNNTLVAQEGDVGSPWAIGAAEGGYRSVHPLLGTVEDFVWLLGEAKQRGLEIALDFAINCSPDHPYVKEHPDWFNQRPDGTIRYAENPPKKYQDIYPINFHCDDWRNLWRELADCVLFWVQKGVKIFRVDNPHTKPLAFWEYLMAEIKKIDPGVLFLAEAFTRPKVMQMLGKIGFSQSYTYFTWRETKEELTAYVNELTTSEMRWYYRANFWPNTPDILPDHLQHAGPASFRIRAALAALLMPSWGLYSGYEFCENDPYPGKEEYNHNEKFQLKARDWNAAVSLKTFLRALNRIRTENPAFHHYDNVQFVHVENPHVLAWIKQTPDGSNRVLVIINLHPDWKQECTVHVPMDALGMDWHAAYAVEDQLNGETYQWQGSANFVSLDPHYKVGHVFKIG